MAAELPAAHVGSGKGLSPHQRALLTRLSAPARSAQPPHPSGVSPPNFLYPHIHPSNPRPPIVTRFVSNSDTPCQFPTQMSHLVASPHTQMSQPVLTHAAGLHGAASLRSLQSGPSLERPSFVQTLTSRSSWIVPTHHRLPGLTGDGSSHAATDLSRRAELLIICLLTGIRPAPAGLTLAHKVQNAMPVVCGQASLVFHVDSSNVQVA